MEAGIWINLSTECRKYMKTSEQLLVEKAYMLAKNLHDGESQYRNDGSPYITHPLEVALILAQEKNMVEVVMAGLLHDVIEDTPITHSEIVEFFKNDGFDSVNLADIIDGLSNIEYHDGEKPTIKEKQKVNHEKLLTAVKKDPRILVVKLADRYHNMSTIEHMSDIKKLEKAYETLTFYVPLSNKFGHPNLAYKLKTLSEKTIGKIAIHSINNHTSLSLYEQLENHLNEERNKKN